MGIIYDNKISIAFDVYGCPQACKHCWLGPQKNGNLTFHDALAHFKALRSEQSRDRYYQAEIEYFGPDFREPHFGSNYKTEYAISDEINRTQYDIDRQFELVSLWRLTRDDSYAQWCKDRGINRAQLKVFGGKTADDYFIGRQNAHEEILLAAEVLIAHDIVPRFQIYLNRMGIASLANFMATLNAAGIMSKIRDLGEEPNIHCMTFDSSGNGYTNHQYRIESADIAKIPDKLLERSAAHFGKPIEFHTEEELASQILEDGDGPLYPTKHWLWFLIDQKMDVYPNFQSMEPEWKIGNFHHDSWQHIIESYVENTNMGLKTLFGMTKHEIVRKNFEREKYKVYMNESDLLTYYIEREVRKTR
jgi:hypothetical protein